MWVKARVEGSSTHAAAHDYQIAFDAIEDGDARQKAPAAEPEFLEEVEAWLVVSKDEPEQGGDAEAGRVLEGTPHQFRAEAAPPKFRGEINAEFTGRVVG